MLEATRTIDPITVEVVENGLAALIREMDATIVRTAMSTVIREVYDFGVSVLDADGRLVHGLWMSAELIRRTFALEDIHEGDVFIFNDPYLSGGEMTHLGDTQITAPVFRDGRLVAFTAVWGHHMDVGGMSASGLPTTSREIYQEGLQIPAIKLFDRGVLNQGVMDLLARNSRMPHMMIGDTLAMTSACAVARRRLEELFERYGAETILGCFDVFAERSRTAVARLIEALPPVGGEFEDVVDHDGVEPGPIPIKMKIEKRDGRLVLDYTGTGPQARGPINLILSANQAKPRVWRRILNMLGDRLGVDPSMSPNHGMYDLVQIVVPDGSLLKPRYPAAVGSRHVTSVRTWEMVQGALARLYPDRVPAGSQGAITTCIFRGTHPETGEQFVNMECVQGGGGGRPWSDGVDAVSPNKDLTIAPVEYLESTFPFLVERTRLRPDSGGAGRYRGGMGIERVFRVQAPELLLGYLDDRQQWPPWGLWGGKPGRPGAAYLQRASGEWVQLPSKLDDLRLKQGDRLVVRTGAGAGWGKPHERPVEEVRRDVLSRLVTPAAAWSDYGVRIDKAGVVDEDATRERRVELAAAPEPEWIDRGERHDAPDPGQFPARSGPPAE